VLAAAMIAVARFFSAVARMPETVTSIFGFAIAPGAGGGRSVGLVVQAINITPTQRGTYSFSASNLMGHKLI